MARNFTLCWLPREISPPLDVTRAHIDVVPTTEVPVNVFSEAIDYFVDVEGIVPDEFTGTGTLKFRMLACANSTASQNAVIQVATEFRTPGAAEALNVINFDGSVDSGTMSMSGTAYEIRSVEITLTPAVTPAKGDLFRLRIRRNPGNASDNLTVVLLGLGYAFWEEI